MKRLVFAKLLLLGLLLSPLAFQAQADYGKTDKSADTSATTNDRKTMDDRKDGEGGGAVSDAAITAKVKAAFIGDKDVSAMHIKVKTEKGVVHLSGNAGSQHEADKAVSVANGVKGVNSVSSEIRVTTP